MGECRGTPRDLDPEGLPSDFDPEVNGDPDSLTGEDDESGFEEMADWPDEVLADDGFEDAGESDEEEGENGDDDADGEEDCE